MLTPHERQAATAYNLAKLPELAFGRHPTTGELVLYKRGETGYFRAMDASFNGRTPEQLNEELGVTAAQAEAMAAGATFGWHVEGADPETWDALTLENAARLRRAKENKAHG